MKKLKFNVQMLLLTFVAILGSASFLSSGENNQQKSSSGVTKYENSEKKYGLTHPQDWQKNEMPKLDLVLFAPLKPDQEEPQASMNVISEKVDASVTLDQFYNESISNLTTALKDVEVVKSGDKQINGVDTKWVIYTHVMQGVKFEVLQYFIVSKEMIYLMTFSSVADAFSEYQPLFDQTAASFKLL